MISLLICQWRRQVTIGILWWKGFIHLFLLLFTLNLLNSRPISSELLLCSKLHLQFTYKARLSYINLHRCKASCALVAYLIFIINWAHDGYAYDVFRGSSIYSKYKTPALGDFLVVSLNGNKFLKKFQKKCWQREKKVVI